MSCGASTGAFSPNKKPPTHHRRQAVIKVYLLVLVQSHHLLKISPFQGNPISRARTKLTPGPNLVKLSNNIDVVTGYLSGFKVRAIHPCAIATGHEDETRGYGNSPPYRECLREGCFDVLSFLLDTLPTHRLSRAAHLERSAAVFPISRMPLSWLTTTDTSGMPWVFTCR